MKKRVDPDRIRWSTRNTNPIASNTIRVPLEQSRWYQRLISPLYVADEISSSLSSVKHRRLPEKTLTAGMKKTYVSPNPIAQSPFVKNAGACDSCLLKTVVIIRNVTSTATRIARIIVKTTKKTSERQETEKSR